LNSGHPLIRLLQTRKTHGPVHPKFYTATSESTQLAYRTLQLVRVRGFLFIQFESEIRTKQWTHPTLTSIGCMLGMVLGENLDQDLLDDLKEVVVDVN